MELRAPRGVRRRAHRGTRDWRELTDEKTGKELSAEPVVEYYAPLLAWLKEQNQGRVATLPEL